MTNEITLWVTWTEDQRGGEIREGQENTSYPSYEDTYIDVYFGSVYVDEIPYGPGEAVTIPRSEFESFPESCVYVPIVRYRDGGTFSSTSGYVYVGGVFGTFAKAKERAKELESTGSSTSLYLPWTGYFAKLENVSVECLQIKT